jgi:hypothetical protein
VPKSVLEAIELGLWDYEPEHNVTDDFAETNALPGSDEKLSVLAKRLENGLPLWHPHDRRAYEELSVE